MKTGPKLKKGNQHQNEPLELWFSSFWETVTAYLLMYYLEGLLLDLLIAEPADFLEGAGEVKFRSMFLVENTVGLNGLAAEVFLGDFLFSEKFSFMSCVDRTLGLNGALFGVLVIKVF